MKVKFVDATAKTDDFTHELSVIPRVGEHISTERGVYEIVRVTHFIEFDHILVYFNRD